MDSEGICKRCGKCCYTKKRTGRFSRLSVPCKFLVFNDDGTTSCSVYAKRFENTLDNGNMCLPIQKAIECGAVPETCGYVDKKYKSRVIDWRGKK